MKKTIKAIGLCCIACAIVLSVYFLQPKTLDFRGTVDKIENTGNDTVIYLSGDAGSYTVVANDKTKISYCCKNDPDIELKDIREGNVIEGNYRPFSKKPSAKFITVEYHN